MQPYNYRLYEERQKRKLSRRQMAKAIGLSWARYDFIESGYGKPFKREVIKISEFIGEDFSSFLIGDQSYPCELPEKEKHKIVQLAYKVLGHIAFKITFIVLTLASAALIISAAAVNQFNEDHIRENYNETYLSFCDRLAEVGTQSFSLTKTIVRPEIYTIEKDAEEGTSKYISIKGEYDENAVGNLEFKATYRTDEYRCIVTPSSTYSDALFGVNVKVDYYNEIRTDQMSYDVDEDINFELIYYMSESKVYAEDSPEYKAMYLVIEPYLNSFYRDFNTLIEEKTGVNVTVSSLLQYEKEASDKTMSSNVFVALGFLLGIILLGFNLFVTIFSFIYGTRKGKMVDYRPPVTEVVRDGHSVLKTDFRIGPFIPETVIEIIGIFLVFVGSFRIVLYAAGFFGITSMGSVMQSGAADSLMSIFMVGMFLLYFIDFDLFSDDKRVFRNIFLYMIVFFCLYSLEIMLLGILENTSIATSTASTFVVLPNMFGSISCYFMIMAFLFYTPKFLKKKWQLIVYRSLAVIPIGWIIASWLIFNGCNGVLFDLYLSTAERYIFNGEKFPFSVLAIIYLVSYYFLKLFYEKKYGKNNAALYFNGNRFIWQKNILVALIVLLIGLVEIGISGEPLANKLGLGKYEGIMLLAPLLLLYHPHKGQRNLVVDYTTLFLYFIAIGTSYIIVGFIGLIALFA